MSTNRPFLSNFLAAFRAQSTIKTQQSSSISPNNISQSARAIASKATQSGPSSAPSTQSTAQQPQPSTTTQSQPQPQPQPQQSSTAHATHYQAESSPPTPVSSTPIPINVPDRRRRGSDSSSGSGGFRDALGPEKWYIGGRNPSGEERFYRLGMVTKGGGRLGGGGRVGSIDQLSL